MLCLFFEASLYAVLFELDLQRSDLCFSTAEFPPRPLTLDRSVSDARRHASISAPLIP